MGRAIKANLGCGEYYAPGWVNVDYGSPHPFDLDVDLTKGLPPDLDLWNIGHAYAGHVLEHLHYDQVVVLLTDLRMRMASGGQLMAVGPDVDRARAMCDRGELDAEMLRLVVDGGHRWPGDEHRWKCRPAALVQFMEWAGWRHAREVPVLSVSQINWPIVAYDEWQCAVTAYA